MKRFMTRLSFLEQVGVRITAREWCNLADREHWSAHAIDVQLAQLRRALVQTIGKIWGLQIYKKQLMVFKQTDGIWICQQCKQSFNAASSDATNWAMFCSTGCETVVKTK